MEIPRPDTVVTVSVPARGDFVHVLRAVTASVAARMGISYDGIEDLRLAVDEACGWLLGSAEPAEMLSLRLHPLPDRLEAVVITDAVRPAWPPSGLEGTFSWQVLSALVDAVELGLDGAGPSIRLSKLTLETSPAS